MFVFGIFKGPTKKTEGAEEKEEGINKLNGMISHEILNRTFEEKYEIKVNTKIYKNTLESTIGTFKSSRLMNKEEKITINELQIRKLIETIKNVELEESNYR